jgi:cytoskeleton protein RodZ
MATVGQELKRERELRDISLKEIADSTKINIRFLRALENDQLDFLPGKFFTKGIIRTYADYIGLESDKILDLHYENIRREEQKEEARNKPGPEKETAAENHKAIKPIVVIISILLTLFIIALVFKDQLFPAKNIQIVIPSQTEILPSPAMDALAYIEMQGIYLDIFFEELTWMRLYADEELILDGLQPPGKQTAVHASSLIRIHTGNAGGFSFFINGQPGKSLGKPGEVVHDIRMNPDNLKEFLRKNE